MDPRFRRAVEQAQAGKLAEAEELVRSLLTDQPSPDGYRLLGFVCENQGKLDRAAGLSGVAEAQPRARILQDQAGHRLLQGPLSASSRCSPFNRGSMPFPRPSITCAKPCSKPGRRPRLCRSPPKWDVRRRSTHKPFCPFAGF